MKHEKVTLPREVAEAIEKARSKSWAEADLMDITNFIDESYQPSDGPYRPIGEYISDVYLEENLPKYMSALVNGYNVEKSPEEKLRNIFEEYRANYRSTEDWERDNAYAEGVLFGIEETLELLDITIEGIND